MNSELIDDKRPIRSLHFTDESSFCVGESGVERIEAYGEPGLHCEVPWFRVFRGGEVVHRCPAHLVEGVAYVEPGEDRF